MFRAGRALLAAIAIVAPVVVGVAHAQDEDELSPATKTAAELMARADDLVKSKKHADAIEAYRRLLAHLDANKDAFPDFPPSQQKAVRAHAHYNTGCALALTGKPDEALAELKKATDAGFFDWQHMEKDEDLVSLHERPTWKDLLQGLKGMDKETARLKQFVAQSIQPNAIFEFDFEVTTLDGEKLKLADLKGKVVIVDCFGTWCPPCREETPSFVKLHEKSKERGDPVVIVGLCWERADPTEAVTKDVKDFVEKMKIAYPIALMKERDPVLDRIPDLKAFPTTLWIDKEGRVRAREEGVHSYDELEAITKALLNEEPGKKKKPEEKPAPKPEKPAPEKKKEEEPF